MEHGFGGTRNENVSNGPSIEHKLIWQYLLSPAKRPLHIRRTLDQYGYSNLMDTNDRDGDQVIFKWQQQQKEEANNTTSKLRGGQILSDLRLGVDFKEENDDNFKVLMVDQLWCWIIDEGKWASNIASPW